MLEELRRRNYAESTIDVYIHTVEHFSWHFHRSPRILFVEVIVCSGIQQRGVRISAIMLVTAEQIHSAGA
jgi:hypothetical protein